MDSAHLQVTASVMRKDALARAGKRGGGGQDEVFHKAHEVSSDDPGHAHNHVASQSGIRMAQNVQYLLARSM